MEQIPQLPGEYNTSYQRLIIYIISPCTTLKQYEPYLKEHHPQLAVTYDTLIKFSGKDNWKQRIQYITELQDQETQNEVEKLFQKLNVIGIHDMAQFIEELNTFKKEIIKSGYKPSYVLKMLKDYILCYRQATEIYYINSRHKLEPDTEKEDTITPDEEIINMDLLSDDAMQERTTLLHNLMRGEN